MRIKILKSISYFDIFDHALKKDELNNLCVGNESISDFESVLISLEKERKCFTKDGYYSIRDNVSELIDIRNVKEMKAQKCFKKLPFFAKLMKSFPFVRGIAISGSLSKNVMHNDGDIDYFIVTSPGRLWIGRTLLILFKKIFLLNSKKYFCLNYFVDENNLKIEDENIFTAIEITHMLPVYNHSLINDLKGVNSWTKQYFPNYKQPIQLKPLKKANKAKGYIERLFKGSFGNRLDLFLMRLTFKRWEKKFKHFDSTKFELTMRSNRGISKHHPQDFQNKVLTELDIRLNKLGVS